MRYIDADKLIDNIKLAELPVISRSVLTECLIPNQPTADVRENIRGEWVYHTEPLAGSPYGHYTCSLCDEMSWDESNFCPNCGAQMRGDNDD